MQTGVFINGKDQVVEMLSLLSSREKEKLIARIKNRNPRLAEELLGKIVNFDMILEFGDADIKRVLSRVEAPVLGVALRDLMVVDQKHILSVCDRDYAEKAYRAMNARIGDEKRNIERACERVRNVMAGLIKKGLVKI